MKGKIIVKLFIFIVTALESNESHIASHILRLCIKASTIGLTRLYTGKKFGYVGMRILSPATTTIFDEFFVHLFYVVLSSL